MALGRRKATERPAVTAEHSAVDTPSAEVPAGEPLGRLLLSKGLVTEEQFVDAKTRQPGSGKSIAELLVDMKAVQEREVIAALGETLGVPFVDLRTDTPDSAVVGLLSEQLARSLVAIPLRREDDVVFVAAAEPVDEVSAQLAKAMKTAVKLFIAPAADIERAINNAYRAIDSVGKLVDAFAVAEASRKSSIGDADVLPEDAPVVRVVNLLISQAVQDRTSVVCAPYGFGVWVSGVTALRRRVHARAGRASDPFVAPVLPRPGYCPVES